MDEIKVGDRYCGTVLNIKNRPVAQKLIITALDGTAYNQTLGDAIKKYLIYCYCPTGDQRTVVDNACNDGDVVTILRDDEVYIEGYIEETTIEWREWKDMHGVGAFTLMEK